MTFTVARRPKSVRCSLIHLRLTYERRNCMAEDSTDLCSRMVTVSVRGVGRQSYKRTGSRNLSTNLLVVCCQWPVVHSDWFFVLGHSSAVHDEAAACGRGVCLVRF